MTKDLIQIKYREEIVGIRLSRTKYIAEITHSGLNEYKLLTSDDPGILTNKVKSHVTKLVEKWERLVLRKNTTKSMENADLQTKEAVGALKQIDNILFHTLDIDDTVDWEQLKDVSIFQAPNPKNALNRLLSQVKLPIEPTFLTYQSEPDSTEYQPRFSFFDNLIKSKKEKKTKIAIAAFEKLFNEWEDSCRIIDRDNQHLKDKLKETLKYYDSQIENIKENNRKAIDIWENEKLAFTTNQEQCNLKINITKENYLKHDPGAILEYCDLVLNNSEYPETFPKSFELDYNPETKILIVEYSLPSIEQLPTLNEVKVIKGEFKEYHISDTQITKIFDATMYNITLRTLHELFEADIAGAIEAISFNGWVNAINKGTGIRENNCILSIQAKKVEFLKIDLRHVDPKSCFKNLKGVGSSKLSGLTAIQPILQISRTDRRFTSHYEVANSIDSSTNLASMDWEDFEHLIREVFGKEFSSNGGEVRVTQASKDGGVDAIAFDPDPIRGGKIVIQAKRYTNTVGVSAVRDLYGTVMNEGATKGILVTTADYGPDAYEFVKGKPLTLMNGSNLLYLLEKHGHQARINIKEAKEAMR